jgi:hypothetical protein
VRSRYVGKALVGGIGLIKLTVREKYVFASTDHLHQTDWQRDPVRDKKGSIRRRRFGQTSLDVAQGMALDLTRKVLGSDKPGKPKQPKICYQDAKRLVEV